MINEIAESLLLQHKWVLVALKKLENGSYKAVISGSAPILNNEISDLFEVFAEYKPDIFAAQAAVNYDEDTLKSHCDNLITDLIAHSEEGKTVNCWFFDKEGKIVETPEKIVLKG